ncbi:Ribosomal RNA small subunit methyltransferase E [Georgfuchsia toluolica]|uniref:Ribosomal RNA small subunit methyltransferase E n=1 Tax=Georgfuchsia toluolica TaxID=424218 RepID=A0A916J6Y9_9PROT|nr:16S rRNA (uracil(1498)-N(3))-methyltransferase [Georgfuchsia toluolica]CAG4884578.1 Ribosomal RNA small subunit methyltransferase E [Georgfuchsia toluolica]
MSPRFFTPSLLAPGASVDLPPEAAHHAANVLRLKPDDEVRLFDGRGGEWTAHIVRMKPTVHVALDRFDPASHAPELRVTLVQALPAADKMDWVMQKAVELGVAVIQPVVARRSVVRLSGEKLARRQLHWRNVVVAACEQCNANMLPNISPLHDLPQYLAQPAAENELRLLLLPGAGERLRDLPRPKGSVTILVGPEGGFEEGEIEIALLSGFKPLGFGPRVLRTETAGLAMLAALMAIWGDC